MDTVLVRDRAGQREEILTGLDYSSFTFDHELDTTWQISFTVYKLSDSLMAFSMLMNKALVQWHGQWFTCEQPIMDITDDVPTKQITATHVKFGVQWWRPQMTPIEQVETTDDDGNATNVAIPTYSATKLMQMAFAGCADYTWEVKGPDDTTQIDGIDRQSAYEFISTYIIDQMGWVFAADNYHIIVESLSTFKNETGKVINYYHDSDNLNFEWDSTSMFNAVRMYGKDNVYLGEYVDEDSKNTYGKMYGDDVTSDTATTASQLNAQAALSVESSSAPIPTMTSTYYGAVDDYKLGDMVTVTATPQDIDQELMVSAMSGTPYTGDPITITWTTGNSNKASVTSMIKMQNQQYGKLDKLSQQSYAQQIGNSGSGTTDIDQEDTWTTEEVDEFGTELDNH